SYTDEQYIAQEPSEARRNVLRRAAESWGTVFCEAAAVEAIVAALKKRGWKLRKRGKNGSYYGTGPEGQDTRIADHMGHDCHALDIVIDRPMTRMRVWRYVADELASY